MGSCKRAMKYLLATTGLPVCAHIPAHKSRHQKIAEATREIQNHPRDARLYMSLENSQRHQKKKRMANLERKVNTAVNRLTAPGTFEVKETSGSQGTERRS